MNPMTVFKAILVTAIIWLIAFTNPASAQTNYVSSSSAGTVDGTDFRDDEDILVYNTLTDTWAMHFDGSDVGLNGSDINAFHILDDGNDATDDDILISVKNQFLPDINGLIDDSDILLFEPSSLGTNTSGTFSLFLDGSTVGLTTNSEEIDALTMTPGGRIVISTRGNYKVPKSPSGNLSGKKEDLIVLNLNNTWQLYFDGSDVALTRSTENVWGAWIDPVTEDVYLTTKDEYSVPGFPVHPLSGDQEEIILFTGTTGKDTSGTFSLFWNGDDNGFAGERLDGISIEFLVADLEITKVDSPDTVIAGNQLVYTVTVTNNGPSDAQNVVVTDTLPAGVTYVSDDCSLTGTQGTTVTWNIGTMSNGASAVCNITVTAPTTSGTIINSASVTSDTTDPDTGNNSTTEDTTVVALIDFGDAPDTYATLLASNGARHVLGGPLFLGAAVDNEPDGQPSGLAIGDDTDSVFTLPGDIPFPPGDEDGVTFNTLLVTCVTVNVTVEASAPGLLNAWVDFNGNGSWADAGEQIFSDTALTPGSNGLSFTVPCTAPPTNLTFARFRFDSAGGLAPDGLAPDGEVEDYAIEINGLDFGDAPDPFYPTLLANNGARHILSTGPFLGAAVDAEPDGQPNATATGDDTAGAIPDDEDGVVFTTPLIQGATAGVDVTASAPGLLNAWIDFNDNGSWADAGEQIFNDVSLVAGSNSLNFSVPAGATVTSQTFSRFRFDQGGGLAPDGLAADGEVEDYEVSIEGPQADISITKTDSPDPVIAGETLIYTVTVDNAGPSDAVNVVVTDTLPAGVTFVSTSGCNNDPSGVPTCTLGTIAAGGSAQYTIEVTVNAGTSGTITNTASVVSDATDPDTGNNPTTENTTVNQPEADLLITKTDSPDPVTVGDNVTYTVVVSNGGPDAAQNVVLTDTLPGGVTFVSATPDQGSCSESGGTVTCNLGNIASGASVNIVIVVTTTTDGTLTNTASVVSDTTDPSPGNNSTTESTTVNAPGVPPSAVDDGPFDVIGNVGIDVSAGAGVLFNDSLGTPTATISTFDATSLNGGTVTMNAATGAFTYTPAPGYEGSDSFDYPLMNTGGSSTATVSVTVSDMIWFIDNTAAAGGDGRLNSPFDSLSDHNANTADDNGDTIFIYSGSGPYSGGITLQASQLLVGQGATPSLASIVGITTVPAHSNALPLTGGTSPSLTTTSGNAINVATNNEIRGLNIGNTTGTGISGGEVGTLFVREVGIPGPSSTRLGGGVDLTSTTGAAIDIVLDRLSASSSTDEGIRLSGVSGDFDITDTNGTINNTGVSAIDITGAADPNEVDLDITFASVSSSGSDVGINLTNTTGSFSVTGTGTTDGSGGTLENLNDHGIQLINTQNVSISNMNLTNAALTAGATTNTANCTNLSNGTNTGCNAPVHMVNASSISFTNLTIDGSEQHGINGNNVNGLSISDTNVVNIGDDNKENGMHFINLVGTVSFSDVSVIGSNTRNVLIENNTGTSNVTVTNSTFNTAGSEVGLDFLGLGMANITFSVTDSSFTDNNAPQLKALAEDNSVIGATISGNDFDGNPAVTGNSGVDLAAVDSGTLTFDVIGTLANPQTFQPFRSHAINIFASGAGTATGMVNGNTVLGSAFGSGIRAVAEVTDFNGLDPSITIEIDNNDINLVGGGRAGIFIRAYDGSNSLTGTATVDATVTNNNVTVDGLEAAIEVYLDDKNIASTPQNRVCLNATGNATQALNGSFFSIEYDFFFGNDEIAGTNSGVAQMQGFATTVSNTWFNVNGNTSTTVPNFADSLGPIGGGTCATVD
jgi:uncharacterized repeat protein (TIGR01451 family)